MQIVHFMYGVGAFISPFIVEPFLLNKEGDSDVMLASETVAQFAGFADNSTESTTPAISDLLDPNTTLAPNSTHLVGTAADVMIQWPFIIAAIYYFVVLLAFIVIMILWPENEIHPSRRLSVQEDPNAKKDRFKLKEPLSPPLRVFVIVVATVAMHAYVGVEISFGSLLSPYAVKSNLHMTKSEG